MSQVVKTALCIHDLCTVGRCSLTVITPVLAALGVQPCPLPTALLSSHFYGFKPVVHTQQTQHMRQTLAVFNQQDIHFDCVSSGFLSDAEQLELTAAFFKREPKALKVVDPVMGDNGKLYSSIGRLQTQGMRTLCTHADVITPNPTECAVLLGREPCTAPYTAQTLQADVTALLQFAPNVVITGAQLNDGRICCAGYSKADGYFTVPCCYTPVYYPGTGDLFTAVLTGSMLKGHTLQQAVLQAARFVEKCVQATFEAKTLPQLGVNLEPMLKFLMGENNIG